MDKNIKAKEECEEREEKPITSKFCGIFPVDSKGEELLKEYEKFLKFLEAKKKQKFNLSDDEINNFFVVNGRLWKIVSGRVVLLVTIDKSYRYEITVELEHILYQIKIINFVQTFMKKVYKIQYEHKDYLCFTLESLKNYFSEIRKKHDFIVVAQEGDRLRSFHPMLFYDMDYENLRIKLNYKYGGLPLETMSFKEIYSLPEIIKGANLNLKLGLYANLSEDDYNDFVYYDTSKRENFLDELPRLFYHNSIGLCGPYGTGKTITLLRFLIKSRSNRIFYVNLWTIENTSIDELKILFKYEILKLFGGNIFNKNEKFCSEKEIPIYQEIINEIDILKDKDIFILLEKIINIIDKINRKENIYIIIDQYSSKYDEENKSLKKLLKAINKDNIFFIISSSMNNEDIRKNFSDSLNESLNHLNSKKRKKSVDTGLNYYYLGCFIRLNNLPLYNDLSIKVKPKLIKYLNKLGNLPLFYYELKMYDTDLRKMDQYMEDLTKKIIEEINLFYGKNHTAITKFIDILKILSIINNKEIYFIEELSKEILNLPLKFIEIKKEEIKINQLKIFAVVSKNQKLLKLFEEIEENMDDSKLNDLIQNDKELKKLTQFINTDNFCSNYIKFVSKKKKSKILKTQKKALDNYQITVYYLDYLFPYMEEIFSSVIYDLLFATSKYMFENISSQTQGGVLEYIINEYAQKEHSFMKLYLENFETIDSFVPNQFFIQNYSSRKKDTLKTFIENKNFENTKKTIPKDNIFIKQAQFTGKYYDCGVLIYKKKSDSYILYLFQVSKKKIESNRYYREEHKIIFNRVKENLESKYLIKIDEGYFSYILLSEEPDDKTIEFCNKNSLNYYLFSMKKMAFENTTLLFDDKCFITNNFPIHSSFSILPKESFETDKDGYLKEIDNIIKLEKKIKFEKIDKEILKILSQYFIPKEPTQKNEFLKVGDFDKKFAVNYRFCIWMDNKNSSLQYYDKNKKLFSIELENNTRLGEKEYSLICSKYKFNYIYKNK